MKKLIFLMLILNAVFLYSSNLDEFDNRRDSFDFLRFFPEYSEENWEVEYIKDGEKYSYIRKIKKIKEDNKLKVLSSDKSEDVVLDKNLMIIRRDSKVKSTVSEKLSYDKVLWEYNSKKRSLYVKNYLNGEKIKSKRYKMSSNTIVLNPILMQAILLANSKNKEFNADAISNAGKYNMDFKLRTVKDLEKIDRKYDLPDKLKSYSKLKEEVYVYELSLTGFIGKFYPHKFYFVFEKNDSCELIAYWGGKPSKAEYQVRYEKLKELNEKKIYVRN